MIAWEAAAGPMERRQGSRFARPALLLPCVHGLLCATALKLQRKCEVGARQRDVAWTSAVLWIAQTCHSSAMVNYTELRAIAGLRAFNGLCDNEGVPLICPTCQVLAQRVCAGDCLVTLHGVVLDILVEATATRRGCE